MKRQIPYKLDSAPNNTSFDASAKPVFDHPPDKVLEVMKRKMTSLFSKEDRTTVFNAINIVHDIVTRTTMFVKAYYLHVLENTNSGVIINPSLLDKCFAIIRGKQYHQTRAPAGAEVDTMLFGQLKLFYDQHFEPFEWAKHPAVPHLDSDEAGPSNLKKKPKQPKQRKDLDKVKKQPSIDYILAYSNTQLITCYENNVAAHYEQYVRRFVLYHTCDRKDVTSAKAIPAVVKKLAWNISNKLLFDTASPLIDLNHFQLAALKLICVPRPNDTYLDNHISSHFPLYLEKMVRLNRSFEKEFKISNRRLFSPLILSRSFIPSHIRLDTNGLAQLLMTRERIGEFVTEYELLYGVKLAMHDKGDLGSSYAKLTGDSNATKFTEAMHATRIWKFLCHFDNAKYQEILEHERSKNTAPISWVFDNMLVTDGYSGSFQVTHKNGFRRAKFGGTKRRSAYEKKIARNSEFAAVADQVYEPNTRYVSGDPGKRCLLNLTDGVKNLAYSSGWRNKKTLKTARARQQLDIRNTHRVEGTFELAGFVDDDGDRQEEWTSVNPTLAQYECDIMSQHNSRSCILGTFLGYLNSRAGASPTAKPMYRRPIFRQHKFLTYCKVKGVDAQFINKIAPFFLSGDQRQVPAWMRNSDDAMIRDMIVANHVAAKEVKTNICILYGNWGGSPNLRGSAPTPGIGLRRKIEKKVHTVTTPEPFTSQTCPCCRQRTLENPSLQQTRFIGPRKKHDQNHNYCDTKHHLLHCTNGCDCSWFNRDVVGAFNILYKGLGLMR